MVRIRMKTLRAGPDGVIAPGEIVLVSESEAAALVPQYAEYVDLPSPSQTVVETAMLEPPENAMLPRPKPRKKAR